MSETVNALYDKVAQPPSSALKPITGGNLKGKSDINPQWRIEALTEAYGLYGFGWKFEVLDEQTLKADDNHVLIFMKVALYVKVNDVWSEPAIGYGGDFLVTTDRNGVSYNDEGYKMCLTDALGNAAKLFGVAANVFRGLLETKYDRRGQQPSNGKQQSQKQPQPTNNAKAVADAHGVAMQQICKPIRINVDEGIEVLAANGKWYFLNDLPVASLKSLLGKEEFAEIRPQIEALLGEH